METFGVKVFTGAKLDGDHLHMRKADGPARVYIERNDAMLGLSWTDTNKVTLTLLTEDGHQITLAEGHVCKKEFMFEYGPESRVEYECS